MQDGVVRGVGRQGEGDGGPLTLLAHDGEERGLLPHGIEPLPEDALILPGGLDQRRERRLRVRVLFH